MEIDGEDTHTASVLQLVDDLYSKLSEENIGRINYRTLKRVENLLVSRLASVRISLNNRVPINQCPPEILGIIFQEVPPLRGNCYHFDPYITPWIWPHASIRSPSSMSSILRLSHVCRYWRSVALELPFLWSNISMSAQGAKRSIAPLFSLRSQQAPLKLFIDGQPQDDAKAIFQSDSYRIEELHMLNYDRISDLLKFPAPQLRYLTLSTQGTVPLNDRNQQFLFNGVTPNLRALTLQQLPVLPANRFDTLTHLCISHHTFQWYGPASSPEEILNFLTNCPRLEDVILSGMRDILAWPVPAPPITLNHLHRLTIGFTTQELIIWFLERIRSPLAMEVWLPRISATWGSVYNALNIYAVAAIEEYPTKLRLSMKKDGEKHNLSFFATGPSSCIHIDFTRDFTDYRGPAFRPDLLTTVREFWLVDHSPHELGGTEMPANVLDMLPGVTTLVLCYRAELPQSRSAVKQVNHVLSLLYTETELVPLPALHTLRIWIYGSPISPRVLSGFLQARRDLGHPIRHLVLEFAQDLADAFNQTGLDKLVDSFVCRFAQSQPVMDLPPICTHYKH